MCHTTRISYDDDGNYVICDKDCRDAAIIIYFLPCRACHAVLILTEKENDVKK